ncbi:alpha/beta hydrolase [Novosphingobium tardum]|uniref:Alpha/beta hydrolase n=1 Tax=Novosphingobium tardum TaxID=1538021 RepID=A0ABV8RPT1_9SPHN
MRRLIALAALLALTAPAEARTPDRVQARDAAVSPITLGETYRFRSAVMDEERVLNVYLPDGYAKGTQRYPVLYLIDGGIDQDFIHVVGSSQLGSTWARSQAAIVVGIATKDRRNELTGCTADKALLAKYPTAGHSQRFRDFIRDEVKPWVAGRYRTDGNDGVIGESLAGLFIAETWLKQPDLFRNYAAISPSLWWDNAALTVTSKVGPRQAGRRFFLATAEEGAESGAIADRFVAELNPARDWCFAPHPEFTHATIYHAVVPAALQFLFPTTVAQDAQYGFTLGCSKKS